jgi:hypothetical protein
MFQHDNAMCTLVTAEKLGLSCLLYPPYMSFKVAPTHIYFIIDILGNVASQVLTEIMIHFQDMIQTASRTTADV